MFFRNAKEKLLAVIKKRREEKRLAIIQKRLEKIAETKYSLRIVKRKVA